MRIVIATCAALSLVIALACHAHAAASRKHKQKYYTARHTSAAERVTRERYRTNSTPDWYPHDSSQLPFGSKLWWEQKSREGGGIRVIHAP